MRPVLWGMEFQTAMRQYIKDELPAETFKRRRVKLSTQRYFSAEFTTFFFRILTAYIWKNVCNKTATYLYVLHK